MDHQDVVSSVISAVGHTHVLEIEFASGRIYQYYDVPEHVYHDMLKAESKGKFFNSHIRGKFPYQEVEFKHKESDQSAATSG